MRISDWSSDVCSSVLEVEDRRSPGQQALDLVVGLDALAPCLQLVGTEELLTGGGGGGVLGWRTLGLGGGAAPGDRTSVVSGKSVSVRVDLGGRRVLKKKQQHN